MYSATVLYECSGIYAPALDHSVAYFERVHILRYCSNFWYIGYKDARYNGAPMVPDLQHSIGLEVACKSKSRRSENGSQHRVSFSGAADSEWDRIISGFWWDGWVDWDASAVALPSGVLLLPARGKSCAYNWIHLDRGVMYYMEEVMNQKAFIC
ncbi:hypothetical protein BGX38DRAFT_1146266 [Terfezia claveryi]|nr:hypothetical protein BGX38DRAFT_1146266 [Terfezia claveryi]